MLPSSYTHSHFQSPSHVFVIHTNTIVPSHDTNPFRSSSPNSLLLCSDRSPSLLHLDRLPQPSDIHLHVCPSHLTSLLHPSPCTYSHSQSSYVSCFFCHLPTHSSPLPTTQTVSSSVWSFTVSPVPPITSAASPVHLTSLLHPSSIKNSNHVAISLLCIGCKKEH